MRKQTSIMDNKLYDIGLDYRTGYVEKDPKSMGNCSNSFCTDKSLGLIGRFPNIHRDMNASKKANRYLAVQEQRILDSISKENYRKAIIIWLCLLKCSKTYQILLFHRVTKFWYWKWSTETVEQILFKTMNKIRQWDMTLLIRRFYIMKKNGKLRPIGCPDWSSRIISKALTDLVYAVSENNRSLEQHGYMKNRGAWSASLQIIGKLKKGYSGYEFDLKSFFNTVEPFIIFKKLETINKELTYLISSVLRRIVYRIPSLEKEAEIKSIGEKEGLELRERFGVPQGLSLSPLLSTWALEYYDRPKNIIMYADDGICFYKNNPGKFFKWMQRMENAGIKIAPEKSKSLDSIFQFCGIEFNCKMQTVKYEGSTKSWHDKDISNWLKTVTSFYGKEPKSWSWDVNKDSFITFHRGKLNTYDVCLVYLKGIWFGKMHKGYRFFFGKKGIFPILKGSSICCNELLKLVKYKSTSLSKIKPFILNDLIAFSYEPLKLGKYKNYYNKKNCDNGGKAIQKEYFEIHKWHELHKAIPKI